VCTAQLNQVLCDAVSEFQERLKSQNPSSVSHLQWLQVTLCITSVHPENENTPVTFHYFCNDKEQLTTYRGADKAERNIFKGQQLQREVSSSRTSG
jgi:hypothetical protein